jgi:hypothetical protein
MTRKVSYAEGLTPALRRLKLATFGHDMLVLHEHDIRKKEGAFARMCREPREAFLDSLTRIIADGLKCFPQKNEWPPGSPGSHSPNG